MMIEIKEAAEVVAPVVTSKESDVVIMFVNSLFAAILALMFGLLIQKGIEKRSKNNKKDDKIDDVKSSQKVNDALDRRNEQDLKNLGCEVKELATEVRGMRDIMVKICTKLDIDFIIK